jgi:hypothetical protein
MSITYRFEEERVVKYIVLDIRQCPLALFPGSLNK